MASPAADIGASHQHHPGSRTESAADSAFQEAQTWIEAVTGRSFGDKDFREALENGILLCELLNSVKPGLVKKINRLPAPVASLDNLGVFLRACEELGLKGFQLFDPGDLQDTRPTSKGSDCSSRKLKNVLITIYWLGRAANGCTSYSGPTLNLKAFEGLLSQMRKEAEEAESPQRSVRDSGYVDCWDSERSDSLSPPHHGREDSFDSLDSFGSRSRQTPSPDVLVPRGSSDGPGSDSESDAPPHRKIPDVRKDDMSARRTSISEPKAALPFNQYLPNKSNQSGYVPAPLRKKKGDKEEGGRESWSTATSPVGGDRPFSTPARSCSEELHRSTTRASNPPASPSVATSPAATSGKHPPGTEQEETAMKKGVRGTERDEKWGHQALTSAERISAQSPSYVLPVAAAMATATAATADAGHRVRAQSESDDPQGGTPWSDGSLPATSMSMIDMRGEEEAVLQPHSQARHELMHNQYNKMKEGDDQWQDDLARWKSRRRSISQDLIKKEEERKMMEQLMSGRSCSSERRRSIKTYREIVEDKERREEDLREAYKHAKSPEEASAVLQRYTQRFSISESVLERLQLPKLLDRSISADASFSCSPFPFSLSPTTPDPFDVDHDGPMRHLRQQSAPAPKFTSTLETRIEEIPKDSWHQRPQIRSRSSDPPSSRGLTPKPVPLLSPKPYLQCNRTAADPWPSKVDGLLRVNGERVDAPATPESRGRESPPRFEASPSVDAASSGALPKPSPHPPAGTEGPGSPKEAFKGDREGGGTERPTPPCRPTSLPSELQTPDGGFGKTQSQLGSSPKKSSPAAEQAPPAEAKRGHEQTGSDLTSSGIRSGVGAQQGRPEALQASAASSEEPAEEGKKVRNSAAPGTFVYHPPKETTAEFANNIRSPLATGNPKLRWDFFAPPDETGKECRGNVSVPVSPQAGRDDRWSWDPDEERKRQERWQQEQERMLQEKYRCEQEKLTEEWEKAQREVAEEERKYHEEERRILEETATPLTPRSSARPSPSRGEPSSTSGPQDTIVRSLADWERKQELLARQSRGSTESVEWKQRKNDGTSDISAADDSLNTGRSLPSQSSSQTEVPSHGLQNGPRPPPTPAGSSTPAKPAAVSHKPSQPGGDRRTAPIDHNAVGCSSPPPAAFPKPPDAMPPASNRSVSGKKLCSSCGQPLGKGAAMIIETLNLYFHIQCFKCGVCKGQLGDTATGTDVRIRSGLLNCYQCYIRSRSAGQPTTL
ncbi:LIM and calponin homology domains-containing protein 1-like [Brachionichthys hirsutus]|uniref:LIM and calponin homology domains-containing protein 1-like n=1 Tax=Brachionichthys hirsutus TaxID=412623 RepID=UPI0036053897